MFNQYTDNAERKIKHWLDAKTIATKHRAPILSACWAFVRHWDKKGRPEPATWHHDFRAWTAIVCGIIEAAGLKSPCASPVLKRSGDRDGADMRQFVEFLQLEKHYTFEELIELCEDHELFERFLALQEKSIASFRSSFSKFLRRYDQRFFAGGKKFVLEGTRNNRTYRLTTESKNGVP
jgi:hypothetical protein